jgi:2-hydroxychromene-2-carboxylate isomerase
MSLHATLFTDSACPWGYSANPDLTVLQWRYGSSIIWQVAVIGLAETPDRYVDAGYTPTRMVAGYANFRRRFGMPFQADPRPRVTATREVCRAVVATRLVSPEHEWAAVRALQFAWFNTPALLDEPVAIGEALTLIDGLDVDAVLAKLAEPETEEAYQADRALARSAEGGATHFQGKSANSDGAERFTAPSVVFRAEDGTTLEAGGFQSLAVYDTVIANLDRTLPRRGPATTALEVLQAFEHGVTTQEVAAVLAPSLTEPDRDAAEVELLGLLAGGQARRTPLGDDALWRLAV